MSLSFLEMLQCPLPYNTHTIIIRRGRKETCIDDDINNKNKVTYPPFAIPGESQSLSIFVHTARKKELLWMRREGEDPFSSGCVTKTRMHLIVWALLSFIHVSFSSSSLLLLLLCITSFSLMRLVLQLCPFPIWNLYSKGTQDRPAGFTERKGSE